MLFRVFPPAERVRASSILVIPTTFAPTLGPVLGGIFVTELSWRWVFYVNVPIGAAAVIFGLLFLEDPRQSSVNAFDLPGFLLAGGGLGLVMYGVSKGPSSGWTSPLIVACILVGLVALVGLVVLELRVSHPLLDLRLYHDRLFRSAAIVMTLGTMAFMGVLFQLALFFQEALHFSALRAGLTIFPEALGVMGGAQIVSHFGYPKFGPRRVMAGGLTFIALMMIMLSFVGTATNLWLIRLVVFGIGVGISGVFIPSQAASFATISPARTGGASTLFNAQRQLGGAIGVAALTTSLAALHPVQRVAGHTLPHVAAYHVGFLIAAGIALFGVAAALTIHDGDAAATMVPRTQRPRVDAPDTASVTAAAD
jgi:EmrB/QacA subfamily drug resistance transporter